MGESWHNNHHAFPGSAKLGLYPGQVDLGWGLIILFKAVGLASEIKTPGDLRHRRELRPLRGRTAAAGSCAASSLRCGNSMSPSIFAFSGRIRQPAYIVATPALFFSQHLLTFLIFLGENQPLRFGWEFWLFPLRSLAALFGGQHWILIAALAYLLAVGWLLATLSFKRATDAGIDQATAALAIVPVAQLGAILLLAFARSIDGKNPIPESVTPKIQGFWSAAAQGMLAGTLLTTAVVAIAALVFGTYGYGLFVVSPFMIGMTTGYVANRDAPLQDGQTWRVVSAATALGGIALVLTALEGLVCIVLAAPLGFGMAILGGQFGRAMALGRGGPKQTLACITILPIIFAGEAALPSATHFDTVESAEISASPERVWQLILHTGRFDEPLGLPFLLGVAYPVRGDVEGYGVGALRYGQFSTGTALERVTEWQDRSRLAFTVLTDVPAMREMSPYEHVHAPHIEGYFHTTATSFDLIPLPNGHTRVVLRTVHELKLDPILYWLPLARWVIHQNNRRVLAHIQHQAAS